MSPTEEFESLLKDVVNAKRLSASKMTTLTDLVMKNLEHDTQLVSVLYRTHKSLSSITAKIWSLYVFDALSRAAKSHVIKHNVSGDIATQPGNAATFLLKVGGLVEGIFKDMIASGTSESKEKTKKIYDIWVKGNTFPHTVLSQLADVIKGVNEVPLFTPPATTPPTGIPIASVVPAAADPQAALLALLTQAAANSSVTAPAQTINSSQLDTTQSQLALLQQLAHTAASVPSVPQSLPSKDAVNAQKFPSSGVNGSWRPMPETQIVTNEQRYSGYRSPEHESRTTSHFDDRDNIRGRYRGGNFRGRGRGDRFSRNWDGGDYRQKEFERDTRSPPRSFRGGGRDRSKSPPRNSDRWGSTRFTSPPRRPRDVSAPRDLSVGRENDPSKDEFGRDIRPESDKSPAHPKSPTHPPISPAVDPRKSLIDASNGPNSTHDENPVTHLSSNKLPSTASAALDSDSKIPELGLESFNPATFDYTSPAAWEALGKLWLVTHGRVPSQEELVQFVIPYGTGMASTTFQASNQSFDQQNFTSFRRRGTGRGFARGRGGSSYGNSRFAGEGWGNEEDDSQTCAVVLGGGESEADEKASTIDDHRTSEQPDQVSVAGAGRMQKVGDNWVFVRGVTADHDIS